MPIITANNVIAFLIINFLSFVTSYVCYKEKLLPLFWCVVLLLFANVLVASVMIFLNKNLVQALLGNVKIIKEAFADNDWVRAGIYLRVIIFMEKFDYELYLLSKTLKSKQVIGDKERDRIDAYLKRITDTYLEDMDYDSGKVLRNVIEFCGSKVESQKN